MLFFELGGVLALLLGGGDEFLVLRIDARFLAALHGVEVRLCRLQQLVGLVHILLPDVMAYLLLFLQDACTLLLSLLI